MARHFTYRTSGTCSQAIDITVDGDIITDVVFTGGCQGNTTGVSALIRGMKIDEAAGRLEGIDCRGRGTSCPDQLSRALREIMKTAE
ncbi:MAG: TIGR03905 family TSCPD domain-containing protein [Alistipes sp.]|nr:TIGR03905 family TSCPD domain-containing protein [Alistipes sp.]